MKFKCEKYPQLWVNLPGGKSVRFVDGEAEVGDTAAVDALKSLPAEYEVKAVGGRAPKAKE
jgi:hypothetical protein